MLARWLALTSTLLLACGEGSPAVAREPNPAQASDSGARSDAAFDGGLLRRDAGDAALREAEADSARGAPNVVPYPACGGVAGLRCPEGDSARGAPNVVPYPACGGVAGLRCPEGEFCNHEQPPDGLGCGWEDSLGTCTPKVEACAGAERVCGCDGVTYEHRCDAHAAGNSVRVEGPCKSDRAIDCDERSAICKRARPVCPTGQVPSVVEGCWSACVGIAECVCHHADECPEREQYVCHMSAQHCGPYVN